MRVVRRAETLLLSSLVNRREGGGVGGNTALHTVGVHIRATECNIQKGEISMCFDVC